MAYRIVYTPIALKHLRTLSARDQTIVVDGVEEQLLREPAVPTRNRKFLRPNDLAAWELRIGDLRVFYDVEPAPQESEISSEGEVVILAVGKKKGSRLWIGSEEFKL